MLVINVEGFCQNVLDVLQDVMVFLYLRQREQLMSGLFWEVVCEAVIRFFLSQFHLEPCTFTVSVCEFSVLLDQHYSR